MAHSQYLRAGRQDADESVGLLRGLVVVTIGILMLVGIGFGAMAAISAPDGWLAQAAQAASSAKDAQLISGLESFY
ncbi:MAG: hypothetical protein R3C52_15345 [Hyphomonadaceae bacterium]